MSSVTGMPHPLVNPATPRFDWPPTDGPVVKRRMARWCHPGSTTGGFTAVAVLGIVSLSSSGGGLFRRPMTRMGSRGASFLGLI